MAVNAATKETFTLAGKDRTNLLLRELAGGYDHSGGDASDAVERAIDELGIRGEVAGDRSYLAWYRMLNFNYPFLDYSDAAGRAVDHDLMRSYEAAGAPPSYRPFAATPTVRALDHQPQVTLGDDRDAPLELLIESWLRVAVGIKARRVGEQGELAHKTSPSGGARHPTEVVVSARAPGGIAYDWVYDPDSNQLLDATSVARWVGRADQPVVTITLYSNVDRASWRYRDLRALRPVLIDAGHIVETFRNVIANAGWAVSWQPTLRLVWRAGTTVLPALGVIIATPTPCHTTALFEDDPGQSRDDTVFCTNPLVSLAPTGAGLIAYNHLHHTTTALRSGHADALAYGVPSTRGDRRGTVAELMAFSGLNSDELQCLVDAGLLLPEPTCLRLWSDIELWAARSWYLSLLAVAEGVDNHVKLEVHTSSADRPIDLATKLNRRITRRSLRQGQIGPDQVERLWSLLRQAPFDSYVVVREGVDNHIDGIYHVTHAGSRKISDARIPDDLIARSAIGQPWATGFSYVVYLMPRLTTPWHDGLVEVGAIGQRIALLFAAEETVGVFQSPALVDQVWEQELGLTQSPDGCYMIGIGLIKDDSDLLPWQRVFTVS